MARRFIGATLISTLAALAWTSAVGAAEDPPAWAYPVNPPDFKPQPDDGSVRRVPDSTVGYTLSQVRDRYLAPDWRPQEHPPMPAIVAVGRRPDVAACGFCHRAEGTGGPENAKLAGQPADYILQQLTDYKSGARSTAVPNRLPQTLMIAAAKALTADEAQAAAEYFASLKPKRSIKVVESETAPKTFVANWFLAAATPAAQEPLGRRIVEVPDDLERFESRDPRATFTAYVPPGSLSKGAALVSGQGTPRIPACSKCHGEKLQGEGSYPAIAGRSPTYVFRQLFELQSGARAGPDAKFMKATVAKLSQDDMIAIAAYLATLEP
jgi:cytochrome c553